MNKKENQILENFKKWIEGQNQFDEKIKNNFPIKEQARSNISSKKLYKILSMEGLEDGQLDKVVKDFVKNGGEIKSAKGNKYFIEVSKGNFYINKNYVFLDWEFLLIIVLLWSKNFSSKLLSFITKDIWWRGRFL